VAQPYSVLLSCIRFLAKAVASDGSRRAGTVPGLRLGAGRAHARVDLALGLAIGVTNDPLLWYGSLV